MNHIFSRREKADAWSTVPHRDAQRLPIADDNVRAHRAGSLEHRQCCGICNNANERAFCMDIVNEFGVIVDTPEEIGILHDDDTSVVVYEIDKVVGV